MDELMTIEEVAAYLRIGIRTVELLVRRGILPAVWVGKCRRFYRGDLDRALRSTPAFPMQFLLIGDSTSVCIPVKEALVEKGHFVLMTSFRSQAPMFVKDVKLDKIFLDLQSHVWSGTGALRNIRLTRPKVPVIVLTGNRDSVASKCARKLGVFKIIEEPFTVSDIVKALLIIYPD